MEIFSDSDIAKKMTLSKRKVSYIVSDGLRPVLLKQLVKDITLSGPYTLHYDEATLLDGTKQLDLHVRYWLHIIHEVVVKFLKGISLYHAAGNTLYLEISKALQNEGVPISKLLLLELMG